VAAHGNMLLSALVDMLRRAYPVTARILGKCGFDAAALDFARRFPSTNPDPPNGYGGDFAEFLAEQLPIADSLFLADLAALDWLWTEAHLATDAPVLDLGDLAHDDEIAWTIHRLPLHPAAGFIWLKTPAVTVWQAHQKGRDTIAPDFRAEGALVTRKDGRVALRSITRPEHRRLAGLRLGEGISQAAEATAALYPEADVSAVLAKLVRSGAFAKPPTMEQI